VVASVSEDDKRVRKKKDFLRGQGRVGGSKPLPASHRKDKKHSVGDSRGGISSGGGVIFWKCRTMMGDFFIHVPFLNKKSVVLGLRNGEWKHKMD